MIKILFFIPIFVVAWGLWYWFKPDKDFIDTIDSLEEEKNRSDVLDIKQQIKTVKTKNDKKENRL